MLIVETKHSLSTAEISLLKSLIGQSITRIHCSSVSQVTENSEYEFDDAINFQGGWEGYIAISGQFDETNLGETINHIKIEKNQDLFKTNYMVRTETLIPFFSLALMPAFLIEKIEVYGYSYQVISANDKAPYWLIEKYSPGQAIEERIETENMLLLYGKDGGRILVKPYGTVPWFVVTFDNKRIDKLINQEREDGSIVTKLKLRLE